MKNSNKILLMLGWAGLLRLESMLGGCSVGNDNWDESTHEKTEVLAYLDQYRNSNIDGSIAVAISADGKHAYVAAYDADAIAWFTRDWTDGALTYGGRYSDATIDGADSVAIPQTASTPMSLPMVGLRWPGSPAT